MMAHLPSQVLWAHPPEGPVLVLAPHPDDEAIGPGGSLALHAARGDRVKVVFCTDGAAGDPEGYDRGIDYVGLRQEEASRAAKILGISALEFWEYPDGKLAEVEGLGERLLKALEENRPGTIYYPSVLETHPDHLALGAAVEKVLQDFGGPLLACAYEIYTPLQPSHLIDITSVWELKRRAIEQYASQLRYRNCLHKTLGLNIFRAAGLSAAGVRYAEAFGVQRKG